MGLLACGGPNSALEALLAHYQAVDRPDLLDKMQIDIRSVGPRYVGPSGQAPIGSETGAETVLGGSEYISCDFEASGGIAFPVQPRAWGMDHRELKAEFGDRLAFRGGIDVQHLLPFGTPEQVRRTVRERIDVLGAGGGYILSSSHNLLKAFPLENIPAMYDEALGTA